MTERGWRRILSAATAALAASAPAVVACSGNGGLPPEEQGATLGPDGGHGTVTSSQDGSGPSHDASADASEAGSVEDATSDYFFEANVPVEDGFGKSDTSDFHPPNEAGLPDAPQMLGGGGDE